jgi:hypothetical protein
MNDQNVILIGVVWRVLHRCAGRRWSACHAGDLA